MTSKPSTDSKPLPLEDTLRDLAIFRASDVDLSTCIQNAKTDGPKVPYNDHSSGGVSNEKDRLLAMSYEFVKEGRAVIRLSHRGDVEAQGCRADAVRETLEDVVAGLRN